MNASRRRIALQITAVVLPIVLLTLAPTSGEASRSRSFCVLCGDRGVADFALNLVLFAPLGLLLARAGLRPLWITFVGLALSTTIELLQLFIPGRWPTLRDVLSNAAGCGLGALVYVRASGVGRQRSRFAIVGAVALPSIAVVISGLLFAPAVTEESIHSQWTPTLGQYETWTGTLVGASVGSIPIPSGQLRSDVSAVRETLRRMAPIHIVAMGGKPSSTLAPIVALADAKRNHLLMVGQRGSDLVVRRRLWSSKLRLATPEVIFAGLLDNVREGDSLSIHVIESESGPCAVANQATLCVRRPSAGSMWQLLVGGPRWQEHKTLLEAATLGALFLPLGILMVGASPFRRFTMLATSAALLLSSNLIVGLASVRAVDLGAVLLGSTIGMLLMRKWYYSTESHIS